MIQKDYKYVVSVRLKTYQHEEFIQMALAGILMKEVCFSVEVVVGDDFSTDQTLSIIGQFQNNDKIDIKILSRKKGDEYWLNRRKYGRFYNIVDIFNNCRGKYIAILDGDDYWTDSTKLQRQVDVLESDPEVRMVHTGFTRLYSEKGRFVSRESLPSKRRDGEIFTSLLFANTICTSTVMLRATDLPALNPLLIKFHEYKQADIIMWLYLSSIGEVRYLPDTTTVYRIQTRSIVNSQGYLDKLKFVHSSYKIRFYFANKFQISFMNYIKLLYGYIAKQSKNIIKLLIAHHPKTS